MSSLMSFKGSELAFEAREDKKLSMGKDKRTQSNQSAKSSVQWLSTMISNTNLSVMYLSAGATPALITIPLDFCTPWIIPRTVQSCSDLQILCRKDY